MFHRSLFTLLLLVAATPAQAEPRSGHQAHEGRNVTAIHYEMPGAVPLLAPTWQREHAVPILLTDDRLSPRRVELRPGETVRWHSMAREGSRIVFEREVARAMTCHSLVNFELDGDRLRSAPIQTGDSSSFCQLSPGTYRYHVVRDGPSQHPTAGARQLSSRLEGVIVVRPLPPPLAAR